MKLSLFLGSSVAALLAVAPLQLFSQVLPRATRYGGASGSFVSFDDHAAFEPSTQKLTVEAWVYREDPARVETLISKSGAWMVHFGPCLSLVINGAPSACAGSVPARQWCHIAVTWEEGPNGGLASFYIDGVLDSSRPLQGPIPANDLPLLIGAAGGGAGSEFLGLIDELRIWSIARGGQELRADMYRQVRDVEGLVAAFPEGGEREVEIKGLRGRASGAVVEEVFGVLPARVSAPSSEAAPPPDANPAAWDPRDVIPIRYHDPKVARDGRAHFLHTRDDLHVGIDFTRRSAAQPAFPFLRFFFHAGGPAREPQPGVDFAVFASLDGGFAAFEVPDGQGNWIDCRQIGDCPDSSL
jgi:hypothetical protein